MSQTISSPFLFSPLNQQVHIPLWQQVSHDLPIQNGLSGTLNYSLTNMTPLLVGGSQDGGMDKTFFTTPDGLPAIPGTTIKGLLRQVIEMSTHGRMSQINDNLLSYRDLDMPAYREKLTHTITNAKYETRTKSGWLKFKDGEWVLHSTSVFRIENSDIEKVFRIKIIEREAEKIYANVGGIREVSFQSHPVEEHPHNQKVLKYAQATQLENGPDKGYLIFTGQVNPAYKNPGNKHMNFIFQSPEKIENFASLNVVSNFLSLVNKSDSQDKSKIFAYLKQQNHKHGIPVFYLTDSQGLVSSLGLAQMYRIPYENSIGDLRPEKHRNADGGQDFATLLFGEIDEVQSKKGRVSCSLARLIKPQTPVYLKTNKIVLNSPKASFYPTYISQKSTQPKVYNTYDSKSSQLAGYKKYLAHKQEHTPPQASKDSVASILHPVNKGHVFAGKIRFHNISSVELGAIIWALSLGENEFDQSYFHTLGMGKPYGFGKIKFSVEQPLLFEGEQITTESLLKDFYIYSITNIQSAQTLKEVKALHREVDDKYPIHYPVLNAAERKNDFRDIKKSAQKGSAMKKLPSLSISHEEDWMRAIQAEFKSEIDKIKQETIQLQILKDQAEKEKLLLAEAKRLAEILEKENAQKEQEELSRKQSRSDVEVLFEDELGGQINRKQLDFLVGNLEVWRKLNQDECKYLGEKITQGDWYKKNKYKGFSKKYVERIPLVDCFLK